MYSRILKKNQDVIFFTGEIYHRTLDTTGLGESQTETMLRKCFSTSHDTNTYQALNNIFTYI